MKIRVISPIITKEFGQEAIADLLAAASPGTEVTNTFLDRGPASVESPYDEALAAPETVARALEAENEGYDAVLINCMADPGLEPARTVVGIPVVGSCQTAMYMAAGLGKRITILSTGSGGPSSAFFERAQRYGLTALVSVRGTNYAVLELEDDREAMVAALVRQACFAVEKDHADVLLFGCTGMAGVARRVRAGLLAAGHDVPVVDPAVVALKTAEVLVNLGLTQSRVSYPHPPVKKVAGYDYLVNLGHRSKG